MITFTNTLLFRVIFGPPPIGGGVVLSGKTGLGRPHANGHTTGKRLDVLKGQLGEVFT